MGPIWGRQDPGGPHVGPMNFAIWVHYRLSVRNYVPSQSQWFSANITQLWYVIDASLFLIYESFDIDSLVQD